MGLRTAGIALMIGLAGGVAGELPPVKTVFVVLMENNDWSYIEGNPSAPFINSVILPQSSYCRAYYTPPGLRPSLPNYLWLVAGTNFGIFDDNDPAVNHVQTTNHLDTLLLNAGISWRAYEEDITGTSVPLTATNLYRPKHDPFVYFDDVTGTNSPTYPYGIEHIRPFSEFAGDLASNTVARYNFITPNLCHDMHDTCAPVSNSLLQGDNWLGAVVPGILNSQAYRDNGALFIVWDEGNEESVDAAVGMILLSPLAKGGGYVCTNVYSHSSLLRTCQEILGVGPLLGDAANAENLSDLFVSIKLTCIKQDADGGMVVAASGVHLGRTNVFLASSNLVDWVPISTNCAKSNTVWITDYSATNAASRFYQVIQLP